MDFQSIISFLNPSNIVDNVFSFFPVSVSAILVTAFTIVIICRIAGRD